MALESTEQPAPIVTDDSKAVAKELFEYMQKRVQDGERKYGAPLNSFNGRNAAEDMRDELFDALIYAQQMVMERESLNVSLRSYKAAGFSLLCKHFGIPEGENWKGVVEAIKKIKSNAEWRDSATGEKKEFQ